VAAKVVEARQAFMLRDASFVVVAGVRIHGFVSDIPVLVLVIVIERGWYRRGLRLARTVRVGSLETRPAEALAKEEDAKTQRFWIGRYRGEFG